MNSKKLLMNGKCSKCLTVPLYDKKTKAHHCKCPGIVWAGNWSPFEEGGTFDYDMRGGNRPPCPHFPANGFCAICHELGV